MKNQEEGQNNDDLGEKEIEFSDTSFLQLSVIVGERQGNQNENQAEIGG